MLEVPVVTASLARAERVPGVGDRACPRERADGLRHVQLGGEPRLVALAPQPAEQRRGVAERAEVIAEIARRAAPFTQCVLGAVNSPQGTTAIGLYKQGIVNQGASADIMGPWQSQLSQCPQDRPDESPK